MPSRRVERRTYRVVRRDVERDVTGRATQKTIWLTCPFCGAEVRARVWSLCGSGKRCACGALLYSGGDARREVPADHVFNPDAATFATRETAGSRPGAREVEVFAPDGRSFEGERHSLLARGATLEEARRLATEDAERTQLVDCQPGCACDEID